jgi:hypothetical protein
MLILVPQLFINKKYCCCCFGFIETTYIYSS